MNGESSVNLAHFNLVSEVVKQCFSLEKIQVIYNGHMSYNVKKIRFRLKFATSYVLKLWCDCSDNFEYKRLRSQITMYNSILFIKIRKVKKFEKLRKSQGYLQKVYNFWYKERNGCGKKGRPKLMSVMEYIFQIHQLKNNN